MSGLAASLAMFAVLVIVFQVAINWDAVTRGSRTMIGVPTDTTIWAAIAWSGVMIALAYVHQRSKTGLRLRASREDEFAARAAGISIPRDRASPPPSLSPLYPSSLSSARSPPAPSLSPAFPRPLPAPRRLRGLSLAVPSRSASILPPPRAVPVSIVRPRCRSPLL